MKRSPALVIAAALATGLLGCGYSLVGRSTNLPEDVTKIYVQALENKTPRPQVDQILTQAIIDEFVTRRGRFRVVSDRRESHAVLSGAVIGFSVRPVAFGRQEDAGGRATEYEILITARMEFKREPAGDVLWRQPYYQFRETYEIDVAAASYFDRENLAIEEVAEKFAETLVIDVLEGF